MIVAMMAYCHVLLLLSALGSLSGIGIDMTRAITGGVCLLVALLGNVLGKVRRNFFVGIRTPWTIANERVWNATHRFAAKTFFAGGLIGLLAVILRAPFWTPITAILIGALVPAIYSLLFYKQLERRGELS
jgi:immunity protein, SdpI family